MVANVLNATSKLFTLLAVACCVLGLLSSNLAKADQSQVAAARVLCNFQSSLCQLRVIQGSPCGGTCNTFFTTGCGCSNSNGDPDLPCLCL